MRIARFEHDGTIRIGIVRNHDLIDVATLSGTPPRDVVTLLAAQPAERRALEAKAASCSAGIGLDKVRLLAPVRCPSKFLAVGLNYADHLEESGLPAPEFPVVFAKLPSCVSGPCDDVHLPRVSEQLDYEGELGFVIGKRCRHVSREHAPQVIGGYLAINDVSVRDWQTRTPQWTLGKSFDTHGPTGPWVVTPEEVGDPHDLGIVTRVNGELRQQSNTRHLIHDCYALVELISTVCTLEPGDLVATGTPAGVGSLMDPPRLLRSGDVVHVEIERIGALENRVIDEPSTAERRSEQEMVASAR